MFFYCKDKDKVKVADFYKKKTYTLDVEDIKNKGTWITFEDSLPFISYKLKEYKDNNFKYYKYKYNTESELEVIIRLFAERQDLFKCKVRLVKEFGLPNFYINKSVGAIVEEILKPKKSSNTEFYIFDNVKLKKYTYIEDFYLKNIGKSLVQNIAGVEHNFTRGGLHGCIKKYHKKGDIIYIDIDRFYPTLLHNHKVNFESIGNLENLKLIHNKNKTLKGDERIPYKLADNSIIGNFKNKFSKLFNPGANELICINGQLLILMLIEKVEPYINLIQTNTDGIIVECLDFDKLDDAVAEWEKKTNLKVKFEYYDEIYQKDVNNYILLGSKNKFIGEIKENNIINHAIKEYLLYGKSIESTIFDCDDKEKFRFLVNLSDKYSEFKLGQNTYKEAIKIYAYNGGSTLYWKNYSSGKHEKVAGTPKYCDTENLSKDWYIQEAYRRLQKWKK